MEEYRKGFVCFTVAIPLPALIPIIYFLEPRRIIMQICVARAGMFRVERIADVTENTSVGSITTMRD